MRLYAHLFFAIFVLGARAATIPDSGAPELEKKLPSVVPEETNLATENAVVKDVEDNRRNSTLALEDIPVQVILDDVKHSMRTSSEEQDSDEKVPKEEIVHMQVDLKNPGSPHEQEYTMEIPSSSIKQNNPDAQLILRQSFQGVTVEIQKCHANSDQVIKLQSSIKSLNENFSTQVQKLNESLQRLFKSEPVRSLKYEPRTRANLQDLGTRLNILQNNFNTGVKKLAEGVHVVGSLRGEGDNAADSDDMSSSSNPSPGTGFAHPYVILVSLFSNLQSSVSSGMANVAQTMNNIMTNDTDPGWYLNLVSAASTATSMDDPPAEGGTMMQGPSSGKIPQDSTSSTTRPSQTSQASQSTQRTRSTKPSQSTQPTQSTWPTQPTQTPKPPGPFAAIQNFPNQIFQSIQNFIKGPNQSTKNLALAAITAPVSNRDDSKEIPEPASQLNESKPELEKNRAAEKSFEPPIEEQKASIAEQRTEDKEIPTLVSDKTE